MIVKERYDAIVVGARAAGAATAMLLARQGMRVLAVDRARYGSDTLSTHALMRTGVLQLHRWGLLDAVRASGAPAVTRAVFHYPDEQVAVDIPASDGVDALYAPRRTVLDPLLVDAARKAGAEVLFGVTVDDLQKDSTGRVCGVIARDEKGRRLAPRADITIGADGIRSVVAVAAGAQVTREARAGGAAVYGYFRRVPADGYEWAYGPRVAAGLIPTNDGDVCVFAGGLADRFRSGREAGFTAGFWDVLAEASPGIAARVAAGEQVGRLRGFAGVRGYYRRPWGPGWALVGDAGHFRDPITTHGISDAFRDAELLARAVAGPSTLSEYEQIRNDVSADLFAVTERIASYDWTQVEIRAHLREVSRAMRAELQLLRTWDIAAAA
jgi:flavin-dependent dehydrogenase